MGWQMVSAAGSGRDLWVHVTGHDAPEYGRWVTPSGMDVAKVLDRRGPPALDVDVWWVQAPEHRGKRLRDFLWQTTPLGLKLISQQMLEVLRQCRANLEVFDVDIRLRDGESVEGYVGVLEETHEPGPVHSLWKGRRSHEFVASDEVLTAMKDAGLTGLEVEPVDGAFPADQTGFGAGSSNKGP